MRKSITMDESGMFNPSKAPAPKLAHLFQDVEKYNQCHGDRGRFCSGGGGGGGGATAQAGGVQSLEDALAGKPIAENPLPSKMVIEDGKVIKIADDQLGLPDEQILQVVGDIDEIAVSMNTKSLETVSFKELDPNVLAQCEGGWGIKKDKLIIESTIAVNPAAKDYAISRYVEDHMALQATGKMPWLASAHADDAEKAYKAVMVHEVAHAKMMEHTLNSKSKPFLKNNPMHGTVTWSNIVNRAHAEGWQGPSLYGRKNLGECFAESVSLLTLKGTTGHDSVDKYVTGVMKE